MAINPLLKAAISRTAAPALNQSQLSRLCDPCSLSSGDASASADNHAQYAEHLLHVYEAVMAFGVPNSKGAITPHPSNLHFEEWQKIAHTREDDITISYLTFGFPARYEGPVPTPSHANHPSANKHCGDVAAYITK